MNINHQVNFEALAHELSVAAPRQLPYVTATLLTRLAITDVKPALQREMQLVFDRPTDFTLRGIYTRGATRTNLAADVYVPDSSDQFGKSRREYLRPGVEGAGRRHQKKTEFLLTRIGVLPAGWVTTPGLGASRDENNKLYVAGSTYKQIINVLQIRGDAKPVAKRSVTGAKRLGVTALFFAVKPGANTMGKGSGWLPPGVWKHLPGGKITQVLKFVKRASYKERLDIKRVAAAAISANIRERWRESAAVISARFASNGRR